METLKEKISISISQPSKGIAVVKITGEDGKPTHISDGYHTFSELYDHRCVLFMVALSYFNRVSVEHGYTAKINGKKSDTISGDVWKSRKHSNGDSYEGWFLMGADTVDGQISYHLPDKYWEQCSFALEVDQAPAFDGHTSEDVLKRLFSLIQ